MKTFDQMRGIDEAMTTGEETGMMFRVSVEGLPDIIMVGRSPGAIKAALRKIVKQPSMINDVERMPRAKVKKMYRDLGQGKKEKVDETINPMSHLTKKQRQALSSASARAKPKSQVTLPKLPDWGTPESTKKAKEKTPGEKN